MIGSHGHLDSIRYSISHARSTSARLSAAGVEVREYVRINSDEELAMDRALTTVRISKVRYAETIALYRLRPGPRLPGVVAEQTFRRAA